MSEDIIFLLLIFLFSAFCYCACSHDVFNLQKPGIQFAESSAEEEEDKEKNVQNGSVYYEPPQMANASALSPPTFTAPTPVRVIYPPGSILNA